VTVPILRQGSVHPATNWATMLFEGVFMPTYIIGAKLTGHSARSDEGFAEQVRAASEVRRQHGGRRIAAYVTFGRYDLLFITEYPSQQEALAAIETNLAKGQFTYEVAEALALEDYLKSIK
jgi:uncharacterized protein with GYD domain